MGAAGRSGWEAGQEGCRRRGTVCRGRQGARAGRGGAAPVLRGQRRRRRGGGGGRDPAPEQLRAPPRGLLPAALVPRLLPRCAAQRAGAESPPQLQGRRGRVTPPPPRGRLPGPTGRMEPPEGASPGGECGPPEP